MALKVLAPTGVVNPGKREAAPRRQNYSSAASSGVDQDLRDAYIAPRVLMLPAYRVNSATPIHITTITFWVSSVATVTTPAAAAATRSTTRPNRPPNCSPFM